MYQNLIHVIITQHVFFVLIKVRFINNIYVSFACNHSVMFYKLDSGNMIVRKTA